jgi:glycosyltransferase involved in cell wall biosynthesis
MYEAVDHDLFKPGDAAAARAQVARRYGVTKPFVLFVSSLWPYKNCDGLLRAWASPGPNWGTASWRSSGHGQDKKYVGNLAARARRSARHLRDVVFVGGSAGRHRPFLPGG